MRDIKFRAWQKDKKIMCEITNIHFKTELVSLKEKVNVTNTRPFNDVILMQYTGLHDKNGKEIYEGDIVSNGYEKSVVVWIKEQGGFMLKLTNEEYKNEEWTNPMIDLRKDDEVIRKHLR